ncbi:MAG: hypothetical protein FWF50_00390 [Defluviitaleaceae bacterium]|nr:hypothetical protein [Defluviitaleaceae bacterium]
MDELNKNERFKIASTLPDLKDKITINITSENPKKIYWYIKFNLQLHKKSVTEKSMIVIDMKGNILKTNCSYDEKNGIIVVSPLESYEKNKYYILSINRDIHSSSGKKLEKPINIMFKLKS